MSSSATAEKPTNIAEVLQTMGGPGMPVPDLQETIKQVESVKTVKFAFHPWYPHPNFGPDGFRFNIPYPVLNRLELIPLAVFQYPEIVPRASGQFALMGATLAEAVPSMSSQSKVTTRMQMPSVSMRELHVAYSKFGMVELASLTAQNEEELAQSFVLFHAVMAPARRVKDSEGREIDLEEDLIAGRRPADMPLEDYAKVPGNLLPSNSSSSKSWLVGEAPRALRSALKGIKINGRTYSIAQSQIAQGEKLIQEIHTSILRAHEAALSPSDGILPNTKKLLNITANRGQGGKTFVDHLDMWLMDQYPSFAMDTDVERARKSMQSALEANSQGSGEFNTGIMAILQQQQVQMERQQVTLDLLAKHIAGGSEKPKGATSKPKDPPV